VLPSNAEPPQGPMLTPSLDDVRLQQTAILKYGGAYIRTYTHRVI